MLSCNLEKHPQNMPSSNEFETVEQLTTPVSSTYINESVTLTGISLTQKLLSQIQTLGYLDGTVTNEMVSIILTLCTSKKQRGEEDSNDDKELNSFLIRHTEPPHHSQSF